MTILYTTLSCTGANVVVQLQDLRANVVWGKGPGLSRSQVPDSSTRKHSFLFSVYVHTIIHSLYNI